MSLQLSSFKLSKYHRNVIGTTLRATSQRLRQAVHKPHCTSTTTSCPEQCKCAKDGSKGFKRLDLPTAMAWKMALLLQEHSDMTYPTPENVRQELQALQERLRTMQMVARFHQHRYQTLHNMFSTVKSILGMLIEVSQFGCFERGDLKYTKQLVRSLENHNLRTKKGK
jgi:hypothetical protein